MTTGDAVADDGGDEGVVFGKGTVDGVAHGGRRAAGGRTGGGIRGGGWVGRCGWWVMDGVE